MNSDKYSIQDLKSHIQKIKNMDDLVFLENQLLRTKSSNDGTTPLNHKDELNPPKPYPNQPDPTFQIKFVDGDKDFFDKVNQTLKTIYKNTTKHLKAKPGVVLELFSVPLRLVSQSIQQSTTTLLGKESITLELPNPSMNKVVEAMDELLTSINNSKLAIASKIEGFGVINGGETNLLVRFEDINNKLKPYEVWSKITGDEIKDKDLLKTHGLSHDELMKHLLLISPIQAATVFGKPVDALMDINALLDNLASIKTKLGSDQKSSEFVDMTIKYLSEAPSNTKKLNVKKMIASGHYEALVGSGKEVASKHHNLKIIHNQLKKMGNSYVKTEDKSV